MGRKRLDSGGEERGGGRRLERLLGPPPPGILEARAPAPDESAVAMSTLPRVVVSLLLDASTSMRASGGLMAITGALPAFRESILSDSLTARKLSWAVLTYAETPTLIRDYGPIADWEPPAEIEGRPWTAMGTAILDMFRHHDEHVAALASRGVPIQHSFCFHVTDGEPNTEPPERLEEAARRIEQAEASGRFSFFSIAVEGANLEILKRLTPRRTPLRLSDVNDFARFFRWLSQSIRTVSHSVVGERVKLPNALKSDPQNPVGWGEV